MSLFELLGFLSPRFAYINAFTQYDEEGYPIEDDDWDDDEDEDDDDDLMDDDYDDGLGIEDDEETEWE